MLFYLTTLSMSRFLTKEPPVVTEGDTDTQRRTAVDAWNHNDFLCRNYILNSLDDVLYGVYCSVKTAKELWNSLEKKYKTEDAGVKKFVVGKFLDYKMVDAKSVMSQVQEIQIIIHDLIAEGMEINDKDKSQNRGQANVVQDRSVPIDLSEIDLSAVVFEANLVDNPREWWVDTGATSHICSERGMFSSYTAVSDRKLYMGNSTTSDVVGIGNVVLKMTS
ncbi:hypothetical protein F511_41967 [Dorcoceras hygrometricum]|uniref:Retrovirus-related Pol polyprotein from transposon TNT 1-94-like beta-barrel domain-containing protein n=1 Tax=Dorcoceras hygrometricum TaxID=472368 RepID=A0A2Z6ZZA2_9LAMI|nr:hypothetical protein F511_41967 [Dorcoceras hygrometricum]